MHFASLMSLKQAVALVFCESVLDSAPVFHVPELNYAFEFIFFEFTFFE